MQIFRKGGTSVLCGMFYAAILVLLSQAILRSLGGIVGWIGSNAGLEQEVVAQIAMALGQLKDAKIISPWLPGLVVGGSIGSLLGLIPKRPVRICVSVWVGVLMLIPCLILAVCFTEVNSILVVKLLRSLLPLLSVL